MAPRQVVNDMIDAGNRAAIPTAEEVIGARVRRRDERKAARRKLARATGHVLLAAAKAAPGLLWRLAGNVNFQLLAIALACAFTGRTAVAVGAVLGLSVLEGLQRIAGEIREARMEAKEDRQRSRRLAQVVSDRLRREAGK